MSRLAIPAYTVWAESVKARNHCLYSFPAAPLSSETRRLHSISSLFIHSKTDYCSPAQLQ
ncbi:hypothetical protein SPI02_19500 [Staphylococcus piscifermentans]|uniref:Uncharacterized protein n=1 Tax=Staphylococcus piscifermentans TaxID=70258 RepID=A0A512QPJ3_9STAP|nr:hypothetical protein SPI02_19500 [Staphylococcus piscifermentans]